MSLRRVLQEILRTLERIEERMSANDDALAALNSTVADNTTATNAAVAALANAGGSDDISAGVNAAAAEVTANTQALNTASTPAQPTNEAGTVLPPQ